MTTPEPESDPSSTEEHTDDVQIRNFDRYGEIDWEAEEREWLALQFEALTTELVVVKPSEWAEASRYLPPSVTSMPGYYRFDVAPYLREILDCLSVNSPIRLIAIMKAAQIGITVGVIENAIGYFIAHIKTAPVMMVTADGELAKLRMEANITPMLVHSGLADLIKASDANRGRKTGWTEKKLEWEGGGYLVPLGAQNANKLRSASIQILLRDEIDGWPLANKDGDPLKLVEARTKGFEESRKILDCSTPGIKGASKIHEQFMLGDQRFYFVKCLGCEHSQTLRWKRTNKETGEITGIVWDMKGGKLVPGSVRYKCEECGHPHINDDKMRLLSPDHGAEWRPTAVPAHPDNRSYHINALYSPVGMQTWEACVREWLQAWDEERNEPIDVTALQTFYNNILGEPFEVRGEKVRFESVSAHRRDYHFGEVPNKLAEAYTGAPIMLLTGAVDIHKDNLAVAVFGWCHGRTCFLIDYWRFEGDTENLEDAGTWGRLRELVEGAAYHGDDGKRYPLPVVLVDSGYRADQAYQFANEYASNVYPIKGREMAPKGATLREFSEFTTPMGTVAFSVTVDLYKERWHGALKRNWSGIDRQPTGHFNAPRDADDKQLKELTAESKRPKVHKTTGRRIGFEWHRPSGSRNELWDLLVYNAAALDMLAWNVCVGQLEMDNVNWPEFWHLCKEGNAEGGPMFYENK